ncbi:MAG: DUF5667 domain-containing protein [Dehalococcoidia bacterium]
MMNRGFDDILDACLDRITQKGDSIEQCLESYPEQAGELEPLLRAALSVDVSSIEPRTEFQRMAKARLLSAVAATKEKEGRRRLPLWNWQQRWAVALAVVLALVMMGGGTVAASTNSLPGDVLYPVKTTTERVQAFFTFGKEAKANLCMRFAERRIVEIEALAERERNIPESVLSVMNAETDRAIALANQNGSFNKETIARLVRLTTAQKMMLARMGEGASLEVKLRFQEALRRAVDAYGRAVVLRERIHKWQNMEIAPAPNESLPVEDKVMIQPGYRLSKTEMGI